MHTVQCLEDNISVFYFVSFVKNLCVLCIYENGFLKHKGHKGFTKFTMKKCQSIWRSVSLSLTSCYQQSHHHQHRNNDHGNDQQLLPRNRVGFSKCRVGDFTMCSEVCFDGMFRVKRF